MGKPGSYRVFQEKLFIENILKEVKQADQSELLKTFIENLYLHFPLENGDSHDVNYKQFAEIAEQVFEFIQKRHPGEIKLSIDAAINSKNNNNKKLKYSSIKIVNDDMPFLVDSVKEELARKGFKIYEITHPVIRVKRDKKGIITDLFGRNEKVKDTYLESVIYIHCTYISSKKLAEQIEADLKSVLDSVRLAVLDWQNMVQNLDLSLKSLQDFGTSDYNQEEIAFLNWLKNNNFTFLGYNEYKVVNKLSADNEENTLGIVKNHAKLKKSIMQEVSAIPKKAENCGVYISKINTISPVHRHANMDLVCIYYRQKDTLFIRNFVGLFTSVLFYQSVNIIPLMRKKIEFIKNTSGFASASYSGKEIVSILEALPREELLQVKQENLFELVMGIYHLLVRPKLKLFICQNNSVAFTTCMIFIPRERFSYDVGEKIIKILELDIGELVSSSYMPIANLPISCLYVQLKVNSDKVYDQLEVIENKLKSLVSLWDDKLHVSLVKYYGESKGEALFSSYKHAFPIDYQERFSNSVVINDIEFLEAVQKGNEITFNFLLPEKEAENNIINLKIFSSHNKVPLSEIIPILENMGFRTIDEDLFAISTYNRLENPMWIHNFRLTIAGYETQVISEIKEYVLEEPAQAKQYIEEALSAIWLNKVQNDSLNKLILRANLSYRQVMLVRAICKYIRQTGFSYSEEYVNDILTRNPQLCKLMVKLFYSRFDPRLKGSREKQIKQSLQEIDDKLSTIVSNIEDFVLRKVLDIIKAILRTNYFQKQEDGQYKEYVSFKLNSSEIPGLPLPVPYAEIFVYCSNKVEAIHLRGGKVSRGGIRWSDRSEDFRTEVLGLMKAQMTKNAIIVPVGAKGGFVVKKSIALLGRTEYLKEGQECYKIFLRGLLDVTDNIVQGVIQTPMNVIRYDGDDPYLVVAADKGTATFSDIANSVAAEYNFWLGDAFASGGSAGYDHKKMAITARGTWISVIRHFQEIGIDVNKQEFTVVGIGDMSGDVFGNGMLLSDNILLVAAFNHAYMFIDPKPDSKISFKERKRLFDLAGSNWNDYDTKLISQGGGIFDRKAKTIKLTKEIKDYFNINKDEVTPDQLIRILLTAKVDLLWNGGIGTYVKSSEEVNEQVGDKTNDSVRVDGKELHCRAVAEGGNLGCTQRGRIEYALNGGKINTDYIDNSAGVDCSDHEVNIKIALQESLIKGKLTKEKRDKMLAQMTDEIAHLVLRDNILQTQIISMIEQHGHALLSNHIRLITALEAKKVLNRSVEFLPSKQELTRRDNAKQGLTRPEISVLVSYSKFTIYNELIFTDIAEDQYFADFLLAYFPKTMSQQYKEEIANHRLRQEIIATMIANSLVNRMGASFYHFVADDTAAKGSDIARAYVITVDAFDLRAIWEELSTLDNNIKIADRTILFTEINKMISRCVFWLLRNFMHALNIAELVAYLKPMIKDLMLHLEVSLAGKVKKRFSSKLSQFKNMNITQELAHKIACISVLSSAYDIVSVAAKNALTVTEVGKIYFEIGARVNFDWLRACIDKIDTESYWGRLSLKSLKDDLYDRQRRLTSLVIEFMTNNKSDPIKQWSQKNEVQIELYDNFINDLISQDHIDLSMLIVAVKRSEALLSPAEF
ncbi:NAD-specific glutamate dehydrogenase [Rickettsiales bacterium Ac37b]|nr:NAD-specific glutamate dehydrogenase [Rickettsiales bacterium Ac37b]